MAYTSFLAIVISKMKRKDTLLNRLIVTSFVSLVFSTAEVGHMTKLLFSMEFYKKVVLKTMTKSELKTKISSRFSVNYVLSLSGKSSLLPKNLEKLNRSTMTVSAIS